MPNIDADNGNENDKNMMDNSSSLGGATSTGTGTKPVEWSPENESIMVEWCDVAQCYKWLNTRSHQKYSYMNAWFTIPAIVLSTISGTASFAQTSLPTQYQTYSPMAIGAINIFIGILTTVQQYLKIAELNEAHRVSSISWDKFARNIRIELAKKPEERMDAGHFLKLSRQEFDRLMETSPMINDDIVKEFNNKFQGKPGSPERNNFEQLKKPDICDNIVSANETRHRWYLDLDKNVDTVMDIGNLNSIHEEILKSKDELIQRQQNKIHEKESEIRRKQAEELEKIRRQREEFELSEKIAREVEETYKQKTKCLDDYVERFHDAYQRNPDKDEITQNMSDNVDPEVLQQFFSKYKADENV
jgi:ElaB/YqjD/DUF883 family membrane-anchored ribosome-binding protein